MKLSHFPVAFLVIVTLPQTLMMFLSSQENPDTKNLE